MAAEITPPGKAQLVPCPDCDGIRGRSCHECHGQGSILLRACPLCGDLGWSYVNGTDDRDGMVCGLGCGYLWSAHDPGWRAQMRTAGY